MARLEPIKMKVTVTTHAPPPPAPIVVVLALVALTSLIVGLWIHGLVLVAAGIALLWAARRLDWLLVARHDDS